MLYRCIARCSVGDGSTVLFWEDLWFDNVFSHEYPRLFSFAKDHHISVKRSMEAEYLDDLFNLPLSYQAFQEYQLLQQKLQTTEYDSSVNDQWSFIWGNGIDTSRRFYGLAFSHMDVHPIFKWLWKSKCIPRLKFFAWLVLVDRLNTKTMLSRRNFTVQPDLFCVLCNDQVEEDIMHLFFHCPFATACWHKIEFHWQISNCMYDTISRMRHIFQSPYFMEVFVIAGWEIWNLRNGIIFEGNLVTLTLWTVKLKEQIIQHLHKVRDDLKPNVTQWLQSVM